jgi:hypothetical protein
MIYTIGIRLKYERAFAEGRARKRGRGMNPDGKEYLGGFAFRTSEDARAFLAARGLSGTHMVMGMLADWENDTAPRDGETHRYLLRDAELVKL